MVDQADISNGGGWKQQTKLPANGLNIEQEFRDLDETYAANLHIRKTYE